MNSSAFNLSTPPASRVSLPVSPATGDVADVVLCGGFRLPSVKIAPIADNTSVTLGGGFRLPSVKMVPVADKSSLTIGGGFRMVKAKHTV